MLYHWYTFFNL